MLNDIELVQDVQSGNAAAAELLIKRHYRTIYAYLYRKTGDKHLAYDLTQEVFIKMVKNIGTFTSQGNFSNWLLTIAINQARDYFKSKNFKQSSQSTSIDEGYYASQSDVDTIFEKNQTRRDLKNAVLQLPEYQSEPILLRFFHDMRIHEIAEATGVTESTVKSRLRQGLSKLKTLLQRSEAIEKARRRQGVF